MDPIEQELKQKYPNIRFELYSNEELKRIFLTGFIVPISLRNTGIGTLFMNDLTTLADKYGYQITLTPNDSYGGNIKRLKDFYQRFGFVFNKGENMDSTHKEDMHRQPKNEEINEDGGTSSSSGNPKATGKKWETGLTRGRANPISNTGVWDSGVKRGKANPVTTNEEMNKLNEQIARMKTILNHL